MRRVCAQQLCGVKCRTQNTRLAASPDPPRAIAEPVEQPLDAAAEASTADAAAAPAAAAAAADAPPEAAGTLAAAGEEEEDDDETCGFCRFMKGGGCRAAFTAWSACVDTERGDGGGDFAERCRDATLALRECMLANKDYYEPLLEEEEKAVAEAAAAAAEKEKGGEAAAAAGGAAAAANP